MTEVECMCVLQAKHIGGEEEGGHQAELIVASALGAGGEHVVTRNNLQSLLRRALVVSTELGKMFQRLEKGRWPRVHSAAVRANCHVRSLVQEYAAARTTPPEMQKVGGGRLLSTNTDKREYTHNNTTAQISSSCETKTNPTNRKGL